MIKLIVLDVDGTLTDGKITYDANGVESKSFDVKDGMAIAMWCKMLNFKAAIITGRTSSIVEERVKELGIQYLYQGCHDKQTKLEEILVKEELNWSEIASIGDDLNDYKMLKKSGLSFCPNDAVADIRNIVNVVCEKNGGNGAVREMIEYILKLDGQDDKLKKIWQ